ncbi:MAG: lamin tail domain-containing protein [Myxococcales bacterium]
MTRWSKLSVVLGAAIALSACTSEVAPHEHPAPVYPEPKEKLAAKVESFSVEPGVIKKGEKATIRWKTTDAISISLKDSSGKGVEGAAATRFEGTAEISPTETTSYILSAIGEGGNDFGILEVRVAPEPIVIPEAPLLFAAVPTEISAGEEAYLVWNGPAAVSITDQLGNPIDTKGARSGSVSLGTLGKTTTFTAKSGTQEVQAKVTVVPAVGTFSATPAGASAGQKITLSWTTGGADAVKISERSRGDLHTAAANERAEGRFEDTIPAGLANGTVLVYTLTASNASGTKTTNLQLTVSATPTITEFKLEKPVITRGGTTLPKLSWKTTNAARILIYSGETTKPTNTLVYRAPSTQVATGSLELPIPNNSTDFELIAEAEQGGQTRQTITLKIVDAPVIGRFAATPATTTSGGTASKLDWETQNGAELIITTADGAAITTSKSAGIVAKSNIDVFPGATTEYTLKVTNEAGDSTTSKTTVTVTTPLQISFTPAVAVPGDNVLVEWDFSSIATNVVGAPATQETTGSDSFIDISQSTAAKELTTLSGSTTTTGRLESITFPDGFKFRHYGVLYDSLTVSSWGFVGFGSQTLASTKPTALKATSTPNNIIAPFFERLRGGKVYWEIREAAPNRKLIIQWNKMGAANTGSEYSFEVVLGEDGHIDFLYDVMNKGTGTSEPAPLVGVENQDGSDGIVATFHGSTANAVPAQNAHAIFFGPAPAKGSATFKAVQNATLLMRVALNAGGSSRVSGHLPVLTAGDVEVTEIMYKPVAGPAGLKGQWIEIWNKSTARLESGDITIHTVANPSGFTLPSGTTIEPNGYVVVGQSKVQAENGDTPVTLELPALAFNGTADTVAVRYRNLAMASAAYDDAALNLTAGSSFIKADSTYRVVSGTAACGSTTSYGTAGSKGSPGQAGTEKCGLFTLTNIPAGYTSIAATGTKVVEVTSTTTTTYRLRRKLTFPSGFTFPFDGQQLTEAHVSICGYLTFDPTATDSDTDPNCDNPSAFPSATAIKGVIAPFWDRTWSVGTGLPRPTVYAQVIDPDNNPATADGYLVVQWQNFPQYWGSSTAPTNLNFSARLYQNGNVEYHYGLMDPGGISSSYALEAEGLSATVAVSNLSGNAANVFGHNEAKIKGNTAIRFTRN